jgi:SAM-dependent methyltransferase
VANDWTAGYVSDLEYTTAHYHEQAPSHLNLVALINGCEPPALADGFAYCELGCGQGFTSNLLAAANPQGRFYAVDFNPSHIASARRLAERARLRNIEFIEDSFADLADSRQELPRFDYITLHGVFSWITAENRRAIVRFIRRNLKSGGIVYLSYNAMPGWTAALPLQRLLYEHASLMAERSDRRLERAVAFAQELRKADLRYQLGNAFLDEIAGLLGRRETRYLVHEYLNAGWEPLFYTDVARELAEAKLEFAGSAHLVENFVDLTLAPTQIELLNQVLAQDVREMLKDFCVNRRFRKDVFVRGARRLSPLAQQERLREIRLVLQVPRAEAVLKIEVPRGEASLDPTVYNPILDALAERPSSIAELLEVSRTLRRDTTAMEILGILVGSGQVAPLAEVDAARAPAQRFNRAVAATAELEEIHRGVALGAPAVGNGLGVSSVALLAYGALAAGARTDDEVGDRIAAVLKKRGETLLREGKPIADKAENRRLIAEQVALIRQRSVRDLARPRHPRYGRDKRFRVTISWGFDRQFYCDCPHSGPGGVAV